MSSQRVSRGLQRPYPSAGATCGVNGKCCGESGQHPPSGSAVNNSGIWQAYLHTVLYVTLSANSCRARTE